ncbi:MAG: hypothetical protein KatS3mg109_1957 [Pirellulaceae bacterium]|nr:MAG: hypothetical protein KatS3mg109_1957 [Pirellulaceae bacterium]
MKMLHFDGQEFWLYYRVLEARRLENLANTGSEGRVAGCHGTVDAAGRSIVVASRNRRKRYTHPAAAVLTSS